MVNPLASQTVVIIGGTSGIGFSVAKHVLESTRANVVVASSKQERVNKAVNALSEIGGVERVKGFILDLSDSTNLQSSVEAFYNKIGEFNHLVFTAGDNFNFMKMEQFSRDVAEKIFNIRYWALLECIKQAVTHMPNSRSSSITFTSATLAQRPTPGWVLVGSGVTGALESLSRGLAIDLAPVRVNCVAPSVVNTELWGWLEENARAALFEDFSKKFLTGSVGDPDEVAEAYGYLIRCNYVTGQSITVDGGSVLV
jgi:NAD(P)-dependent dehydrogenase (short-subunit alcohol dehydrogenase family)